MESNTSLLFEMRMLNELRKLKPEQRKEILDTLEREEKIEEDALKKNPNLHVETKLSQVLGELKDLRAELQTIKNTSNNCPISGCSGGGGISSISGICGINNNQSNGVQLCTLAGLDERIRTQIQEDEISNCNDCSFFSTSIDWWPIIIFIFIFLTIFSLPSSKSRLCPIIV